MARRSSNVASGFTLAVCSFCAFDLCHDRIGLGATAYKLLLDRQLESACPPPPRHLRFASVDPLETHGPPSVHDYGEAPRLPCMGCDFPPVNSTVHVSSPSAAGNRAAEKSLLFATPCHSSRPRRSAMYLHISQFTPRRGITPHGGPLLLTGVSNVAVINAANPPWPRSRCAAADHHLLSGDGCDQHCPAWSGFDSCIGSEKDGIGDATKGGL